jgi:DNA-binding CsgD family transcriptional regulator
MFDEVVERVRAVLGTAADLVAEPDLAAPHGAADADSVRRALDRADAAVAAWLVAHPLEPLRAGAVGNELSAARLHLQAHELTRRRESMTAMQSALRRLRSATSVDALTAQVPREVSALGFQRALFSWVEQSRWVPHSTYTMSGPDEARAILEAGEPPYWHTRDLLESEMIRRRRPMLVRDALANPHVHLDIQAVMHSTSYVAAPLVRGSNVVGFVHADQSVESAVVDEIDRDLISMFVEGLGLAFERLAMRDELAGVRARLGGQASALQELMSQIEGIDALDPMHALPGRAAPIETSRTWCGEGLTRREDQVFALLGEGVSNAGIADRLYITEGTAKTHVKHVLRKLGVESRAQAGALYRSNRSRAETGGSAPG